MKAEILKILMENDKYVSGQELCRQLGVSRTAVWKVINQLKEENYEIEAVPNRGYHIVASPDIITSAEIESRINTKNIGKRVLFYEKVDSTNNVAKKLAEKEKCHGTLVVAETQDSGKGRRGRNWVSSEKEGIWMTLILNPEISPMNASMLTLVAALAVNKGIKNVTGIDSYIKWPNDIVVNGKKICGILTEMSSDPDYVNHVVIGIGINVKMCQFPDELKDKATSLKLEGAQELSRAKIIAGIIEEFEIYYDIFIKKENLSECLWEYNNFLVNKGRRVIVYEKNNKYEAEAVGINEKGELLVKVDNGEERAIISGEVSVSGIYGYV